MDRLSMLRAVLAVEAPAGEAGEIPLVLERPAAEDLGDALAADLVRLLPGVTELGMAAVGALYDQTQILSPGFPLFVCLEELYRESLPGRFEARRLILGAAGGTLPKPALEPSRSIRAGPLLLVPMALFGSPQSVAELSPRLEEVLVNAGQASARTALLLKEQFGFQPVHAQYLSIDDLAAMLSLQLDHIGLPDLWTLLEGALFAPAKNHLVTTAWGGAFAYRDGRVEALFQTFDAWARHGAGANQAAAALTDGYRDYLRAQRQFVVTLAAHGLEVAVHPVTGKLPEDLDSWLLTASSPVARCFAETAVEGPSEGPLLITEHATGELGTVAFTVEWGESGAAVRRRENHYPVQPEGLIDCLKALETLAGGERTLAYPGRICCDPAGRCLASDPDALGGW